MPLDPRDKIYSPDFFQLFSEGRANKIQNFIPTAVPNTTFKRMVVIDVISDPVNIVQGPDNKKIDYWVNVLGVSNPQYATVLPRNSIVATFAYSDTRPMFVFPFFPSHMALPCKPGEMIWAMIEDPNQANLEIAYWFCKIVQPHFVDDVNHTHAPRLYDATFAPAATSSKRERAQNDGLTTPIYELRNGDVKVINGTRVTLLNSLLVKLTDKEDVFERIITSTDGGHLVDYEAVPRFKKRPGDLALEGSNNSLIVLGTDRGASAANFSYGENGARQFIPPEDFIGDAGSIDLVVGRGQKAFTGGISVSTTTVVGASLEIPGTAIKQELGKSESQISQLEGDFDLSNDRSRIQISQRTVPDLKFGISNYNIEEFDIDDGNEGDAAIVIKTDKIRLIARSDVEILVTGFTEDSNTKGRTIKKENTEEDSEKFSAIVIKANGDIIIKPADKGMIKLGDDTADRALLCTDLPATLIDTPIQTVVSPATAPISNTMGGRFGGTGIPTQGTWASKVLVTGAR